MYLYCEDCGADCGWSVDCRVYHGNYPRIFTVKIVGVTVDCGFSRENFCISTVNIVVTCASAAILWVELSVVSTQGLLLYLYFKKHSL